MLLFWSNLFVLVSLGSSAQDCVVCLSLSVSFLFVFQNNKDLFVCLSK